MNTVFAAAATASELLPSPIATHLAVFVQGLDTRRGFGRDGKCFVGTEVPSRCCQIGCELVYPQAASGLATHIVR